MTVLPQAIPTAQHFVNTLLLTNFSDHTLKMQ